MYLVICLNAVTMVHFLFPSLDSYNMGMLVAGLIELNSITFQTPEFNDKLCKIESTNEQVQITFVQKSKILTCRIEICKFKLYKQEKGPNRIEFHKLEAIRPPIHFSTAQGHLCEVYFQEIK